MNYTQNGKLIVVSLVASAFLVGCGSGATDAISSTGVTLSGVAVDPELQGATVFLDSNENGLLDSGEPSTITDNFGKYSLEISKSDVGKPLIVTGGIDKVTRKMFNGQMSALSSAGTNTQHITPLTTLVQKYKLANSSTTLENVKSELAIKLGLSSASELDRNVVDDAKLLKVALRVHKVAQAINSANSKDISKIYETIVAKLADANLSSAIIETITAEVSSGSLNKAKILDLNKEIKAIDENGKSPEALALTIENVDNNISNTRNESDLNVSLVDDSGIDVVDTEVESEKGKRTLDSLGLSDLDETTKSKVLEGFKKYENKELSNEDLRKKLNNNELGLNESENSKVRREQLFNDNGLQNLDKTTKDDLKTKFDNDFNFNFDNATNIEFKNRLQDDDFLENNTTLKAKIQGQMNKAKTDKVRPTASTSLADGKLIVGSIIKGPIDGATIMLKDASGTLITSTISQKGIFVLPEQNLTSEYYTIESIGGTYDDEATKTLVNIGSAQGLRTLLTREELINILANKEYIAITPETTIFAKLVQDGMNADRAKELITNAMIKDSSPFTILSGDKFLQIGNFTTSFPKNQSEAFARNRAISFSYMVRDLNMSADKVFDLLDLIIADYKDGIADGITLADGYDINISQEFALSRTKLFQDTTSKLRNGELSYGQKEQLKQMGFNTEMFGNSAKSADSDLSVIVDKYTNATTLPTLHILPVIADEDGNEIDTKETYTLTATRDVNVTIQAPEGSWITPMWRYNNNPLPVVIHANNGDVMTLNFENKLLTDSTIHWHGFKIPAIMDGGPDMPVAPNNAKVYTFTMNQPAAPLWFHPHPDMETGKQVYMGLAGVYLLSDAVSKEMENLKQIPSGDKDTVLLVQDRRFTDEVKGVRELAYKTIDMDSDGMLGDTILVNGSVLPKQEVSNTLHRYRLYNVSNARNYDFALSDDSNFTIIGTDGGFLEKPVITNHIMLGAAQRVEIVVDFSKYSVGDKVMLVSKPFNGDMMGMMSSSSGMGSNMPSMGNSTSTETLSGILSNGTGLVIMRFDITSNEVEDITLYNTLSSSALITTRLTEDDAVNKGNEREFLMSMGGMSNMNSMQREQGMQQMSFLINNTPFDMTKVNEFVASGATEIWSIKNMSPMAHPFHAHAIEYQVLSRNGVPASGTDLGWKDTFLVQPGETVRIIGDFTGAEGDYMYHCHILEHEDAGMMGYFRVGDSGHLGSQQ